MILLLKMGSWGGLPQNHQGKAEVQIPGSCLHLMSQNLSGGREGCVELRNLKSKTHSRWFFIYTKIAIIALYFHICYFLCIFWDPSVLGNYYYIPIFQMRQLELGRVACLREHSQLGAELWASPKSSAWPVGLHPFPAPHCLHSLEDGSAHTHVVDVIVEDNIGLQFFHAFGVLSKNSAQNPKSERFFPVFFRKFYSFALYI